MLTIGREALEGLSALLLERAGLRVAPDGFHGLRLALKERMPALGLSDAGEYVARLRERSGEPELRALLPLVTVTHTEFFRDARQFHALEQRVLPEALARARRDGRKVQIWSAGCATGEEPYSLAMLLADGGAKPEEVDLWATDLNHAAVASARQGRFTRRRANQSGPERLRRWFQPHEDGFEIVPELRSRVRFEAHNLAAPSFRVEPERFDLILCRNVIIYFDLPTIRGLMDRFFAALRPGAFLVLGYSESLFRVYDRFEMVEVEGAFLYRRPRTERPARPAPASLRVTGEFPVVAQVRPPAPPRVADAAPAIPATTTWPVAAVPTSPEARRAPVLRLADAARLTHEGQFDAAAAELQALLRDEPNDLPARLALGNLWSVMGRSEEARRVFEQVSSDEPLCVEARVYAAVAQMQVNRFEQARGDLGKAIFLEPTLALAHYLAAQVSERLGDRDAARRAYRNAISQLRFPQRALAGFYPDLPDSPELISRAARYALAALEEEPVVATARRR